MEKKCVESVAVVVRLATEHTNNQLHEHLLTAFTRLTLRVASSLAVSHDLPTALGDELQGCDAGQWGLHHEAGIAQVVRSHVSQRKSTVKGQL